MATAASARLRPACSSTVMSVALPWIATTPSSLNTRSVTLRSGSMRMVSCPSATRRETRCVPMCPPPATTTYMSALLLVPDDLRELFVDPRAELRRHLFADHARGHRVPQGALLDGEEAAPDG